MKFSRFGWYFFPVSEKLTLCRINPAYIRMMKMPFSRKVCLLFFIALLPVLSVRGQEQILFRNDQGKIAFVSEAPLEVIEARSQELRGVVDPEKRTFAFVVKIRSFQGFNSPLQQEHFNENYLESDRWPTATFAGKIIEQVDLLSPGSYLVRAKGRLKIHGVEQERLIPVEINSDGQTLKVRAEFSVLLQDHRISVPRIVNQKIAEEISVGITASLSASRS